VGHCKIGGIKFEFNGIGNIIEYEKRFWAETAGQCRYFILYLFSYYLLLIRYPVSW